MERTKMSQVLLLLLYVGTAINAQTHQVTSTIAAQLPPSSLLNTIPPTTTGRVPLQPGKFSPCWGTTITNSLTWNILTTTFTNITVVPHVTPFANGTNITSYETLLPQGPAPTHFLSTTMANGSVCLAPTPCVEQLAQGCGSLRERQLFVGLDSTGSAGSTPFTNPSTYITATSIIDTPYTAPPRVEPRVDPTSAASEEKESSDRPKSPTPQPAPTIPEGEPTSAKPTPDNSDSPSGNDRPNPDPSQTQVQSESSVRSLPPIISSLLGEFAPSVGSGQATPTVHEANASDNPRPGSETRSQATAIVTTAPPGPVDLPNGFSVLPSQSGVVLPDGQTLEPGSATTISEVLISLAPSASFIAIGGSKTISLAPVATELPSGFSILPSGSGVVLPNGQTMEPGSATTVNEVPVSLAPSASFIAIGGSKTISLAPEVTDNIVLPNGETLEPGVLTTILGVPVSLSPGETRVIIDGSTIVLASTVTGDLGSYIWSDISAEATSSIPSYGKATSSIPSTEAPTSPPPLHTGGASTNIHGHTLSFALVVGFVHICLWT